MSFAPKRWLPMVVAAVIVAGASVTLQDRVAAAPGEPPRLGHWHDVKCARYRVAWSAALARMGRRGLGQAFLDRHEAFLASNCTRAADVCPHSDEEFRLANAMVVLSMNAGTASTFPPFACRN